MSKKFPTLYATASTGRIKVWEIEAKGNTMIIRNGLDGGAMKEQSKIIKGVNMGKANETTDEQQCINECQSKWQAKIDEQYSPDKNNLIASDKQEIILPMLAQTFQKRKHDIKYPCYVQPKLNGVRCIFQNGKFMSRGGKEYTTMDHLRGDLKELSLKMPDGEIYVHGMHFQEIVRLVKKDRGIDNSKLEYWIYDQVNDQGFENRFHSINKAFENDNQLGKLHRVETCLANNEADVKKFHDQFVQAGYEGVIIRNKDGKYAVNHRSADLQKYKEFIDSEYKITGITQGEGPELGCIIFECFCKGAKDNTLTVRPRGSHEQRRIWYRDQMSGKTEFRGKELTVRYQELSEAGVPIFPVGIVVRDYE